MSQIKEITVVELNRISDYPPVQNLIRILLKKGLRVHFIGVEISNISGDIKNNPYFHPVETSLYQGNLSSCKKIINILSIKHTACKMIKICMKTSDVIWTTSMRTSCLIGKQSLKYKNVLQLMELAKYGYLFRNHFKFPIKRYAQSAWKTVVPEINRAYIQKIWYGLNKVPIVLPNKPFSLNYGKITPEVANAVSIMKNEKRKIILYLGGISIDRDFNQCAKSMDTYYI